jgi:hypothetical protein
MLFRGEENWDEQLQFFFQGKAIAGKQTIFYELMTHVSYEWVFPHVVIV